jgi:hypothetical protein
MVGWSWQLACFIIEALPRCTPRVMPCMTRFKWVRVVTTLTNSFFAYQKTLSSTQKPFFYPTFPKVSMFLFIYFSSKVQHGTKNIWLKNTVTQNIVPFHLLNTWFALIGHT